MLIRTLKLDDIDQCIELEALVYEHVSNEPLNARNRYEHWFKVIDQELAVGMFDGARLIGLGYAVDLNPGMNDSRYRRDSTIIHPDYMGKNKGHSESLGSMLFESLLAMIDVTTPNQSSYGNVGDDNIPMQAINKKFGSKAGGNEHTYKSEGRIYRPWVREPFAHIAPEIT